MNIQNITFIQIGYINICHGVWGGFFMKGCSDVLGAILSPGIICSKYISSIAVENEGAATDIMEQGDICKTLLAWSKSFA